MKYSADFDDKDKKITGGVTGSSRVSDKVSGHFYQQKPSILKNPSLVRRIKARYTDRENFGELIASRVGEAFLGENEVPEVSFVYDKNNKQIMVASKYLKGDKGGVRTLDEYALENDLSFPKGKKHVVCVSGATVDKTQGTIGLDSDLFKGLKQSLANALVFSALVGDHDVNPGNMMVITKDSKSSIARIDFGHAFNDLLNASRFNGGQLEDPDNPVLDFFNRKKVAGPGGAVSKLHRDYPGMIPSQEIVNALNAMGTDYKKKISEGLNNAKKEFNALIEELKNNKDYEGIQHVEKSLSAIYENLTQSKLTGTALSTTEILDKAFKQYEDFITKNCENAQKVANVMQLQLDIDNALIKGIPLSSLTKKLLETDDLPMKNGKILWVKTEDSPAFSGSYDAYLYYRANVLIKKKEEGKEKIIKQYNQLTGEDFNELKKYNSTFIDRNINTLLFGMIVLLAAVIIPALTFIASIPALITLVKLGTDEYQYQQMHSLKKSINQTKTEYNIIKPEIFNELENDCNIKNESTTEYKKIDVVTQNNEAVSHDELWKAINLKEDILQQNKKTGDTSTEITELEENQNVSERNGPP